MKNLQTVILAGGKGSRMQSNLPKVLHTILGKTLLNYTIENAKNINSKKIIVIVGHKSEDVKKSVKYPVNFVLQKEQLGTGHALIIALDEIDDDSNILILCGDTPLLTDDTLTYLLKYHEKNNYALTLISNHFDNPTGYGRVIREGNNVLKIVEEKDATDEQRKIKEVNTGIYCFKGNVLREALKYINNNNAQNEYYLPDTLEAILKMGLSVGVMLAKDNKEFLGINTKIQLSLGTTIMQNRINNNLMLKGVIIEDPNTTYISKHVSIGIDTVVKPNTTISGNTSIGTECIVGSNTTLHNMTIENNVNIVNSVCYDSSIKSYSSVGPFAYIRPNSNIGEKVKIGDFVEIKNSTIGNNSKASHLSYIGDATIGENVNVGCGTITVNYDGKNKFKTIIEDNVFIGCNSNLVAPVTLEKNSTVAAGTTVTKKVDANSLSIGRVRQVNLKDYKR